jgi:Reverse transcriptase (RNA-dependent DNA polymerase)
VEEKHAHHLYVTEHIADDLILGTTWLRTVDPTIDWRTKSLRVASVQVEKEEVVKNLLSKFGKLVNGTDKCSLPPHRNYDCEIPLIGMPPSTSQTARRISPDQQKYLDIYLKEQMQLGRIVPSKSSIASQILFVPKKDKSIRICVDYRKLNDLTHRITFPMPRIDELLERTGKAKFFSSIDLKDAYYLLRMKKSDQWKTAFISPNGTFEYTVMPFGLKNAPGQFQKFIDHVLAPLEKSFVLAYLDNILVFSNSKEEHEQHLTLVLQTLQKAELRIKPSKCLFFKESVPFLGFTIGQGNLSMNSENVQSITDWQPPSNVKGLQRFLRFINFYRRFIPNLSQISKPMICF